MFPKTSGFRDHVSHVCDPLSPWWVVSLCQTLQAGANFVSDQGISQQCGLSHCGRHWCWHAGIFQKRGVPGWGILLESPFYMEGCSIKGLSSQKVHRSCGVSKVMEYVQWLHESDWKILRVYGTPSPKCPQITLNQKTIKMKKKMYIHATN